MTDTGKTSGSAEEGAGDAALAGKAMKNATRTSVGTGPKVDKVSVSMPMETVRTVREMAAAADMSVSAWLTQAAEESAARSRRMAAAREAAAEYATEVEAVHGPATQEEHDRVNDFFAELAAYARGAFDQAA